MSRPDSISRTPVGARVGAILSADRETVRFLGFGVYDGEQDAPFGPLGASLEEYNEVMRELFGADKPVPPFRNPRITLDDGRVVWGCECWWGPEDQIRAKIGGRTVVPAITDREAAAIEAAKSGTATGEAQA